MYIVSLLEDSQDIAGHNFGSDDSDAEDESWTVDRARAGPMLVQLASLGRRVDMIELGAPRRHL